MDSILINLDAKPNDSVYYISGCVLEEINNSEDIQELFNIIRSKYNETLTYHDYVLSLNFLFLIGKLTINDAGDLYVYKKISD